MGSPKNQKFNEKVCLQTQDRVRVVIPREERGIEEFHDEEFLARKSSEENEEFQGLKKSFLEGKS